ncbi:MAG: amidohydrolase family protein [Synergistaceae bacterium]|nr:amidohydrolase family protein [Synergistaceae bacterium]
MLTDIHIHTGNFNGGLYFSPEEISLSMKALNVERYYFSSTSTGNLPFREVRREIESLVEMSHGHAIPFLWVSPGMLRHSRDLRPYFFRDFAGIKIHGLQGWNPHGKEIRRAVSIAGDKNLPVMLHTGDHEICRAGAYLRLCREFGDVRIILAHGRPLDECITVMKECPNVYADTAFMSVNNILILRNEGLIERVFWGTDFPVMRYFYDIPPEDYYRQKISEAINILGESDFTRITQENFNA